MLLNQSQFQSQAVLSDVLVNSRQMPPSDWHAWYLEHGLDQPSFLGWLPPERAVFLAQRLPHNVPMLQNQEHWVWHAAAISSIERSQMLQTIANELHQSGGIQGWRDELYACWGNQESAWPYVQPEFFRLERAAFRYWGLRSHAVHVNGITADGRMWCGRRALHKATDPGLLDNLAAGGLSAGEHPMECAVREIAEEAGLHRTPHDFMGTVHDLVSERAEPDGWHNERLFVYTVSVSADEHPVNRDGEVSEFLCLEIPEVLRRIHAGEFTQDAAHAIRAIRAILT